MGGVTAASGGMEAQRPLLAERHAHEPIATAVNLFVVGSGTIFREKAQQIAIRTVKIAKSLQTIGIAMSWSYTQKSKIEVEGNSALVVRSHA